MPARSHKPETVKWTGKNLSEIKKFYKHVRHFPLEKDEQFTRDESQHPDNLHIDTDSGTVIARPGDTISKDAEGRIAVTNSTTRGK